MGQATILDWGSSIKSADRSVGATGDGRIAILKRPCYLSEMSQKERVIEAIQDLPDDASIDQIADRVEFIAAIHKGIADIDRGEVVPHEEIRRQFASWRSE